MPWLTDLPAALASSGLAVVGHPGWETRSRSRGPLLEVRGIVVHHTASNPPGTGDVEFIATRSSIAPVSHLYLGRDGVVTIIAAGGANHAGAGGPLSWAPKDRANDYAIGIEAANDGRGEVWPKVQQDAYVALCAALCRHYALPVNQVVAHKEWAPTRKVDPFGPSRWADGAYVWNMDAFRADVTKATTGDDVTQADYDALVKQIADLTALTWKIASDVEAIKQKLELP